MQLNSIYMSPALLTVSAIFELVRYFPVGPTQNPRTHSLSLCSLSKVILRSNETSFNLISLCFLTNFDNSTINPRTFTGLDETIHSKIVLLEAKITSLRYATLKSDTWTSLLNEQTLRSYLWDGYSSRYWSLVRYMSSSASTLESGVTSLLLMFTYPVNVLNIGLKQNV